MQLQTTQMSCHTKHKVLNSNFNALSFSNNLELKWILNYLSKLQLILIVTQCLAFVVYSLKGDFWLYCTEAQYNQVPQSHFSPIDGGIV